jgi:hypothetical protein
LGIRKGYGMKLAARLAMRLHERFANHVGSP